MVKQASKKRRYIVFFDFDNTITRYDILDDIIARFSANDRWVALEEKWVAGRIGSRECLDGQIRNVRITRKALAAYLAKVKVDPAFKKILKLCRAKKIKTYILSDDFGFVVQSVLRANGIRGIKVYCNRLSFADGMLVPHFPFLNTACHKCAHCKKGNLIAKMGKAAITVYVGDGLSDICPAECADIVFAKGKLKKYFKTKKLDHIPFKKLDEVHKHLKRSIL